MQNIVADAYRAPFSFAGPLSGVIEEFDSGQEASFQNLIYPNHFITLLGQAFMKGLPDFYHRYLLLFSGANIGREMVS